jgi:hypothetical protein
MADYTDYLNERDKFLTDGFSSSAMMMRHHYREWIQEELVNLTPRADALETLAAGTIKRELQEICRRLREVDQSDLKARCDNVRQRSEDIRERNYESPMDARAYLDESYVALDKLVEELLKIRRFIVDQEGD